MRREKQKASKATGKLKLENEDAIVNVADEGWNKATNAVVDQIFTLKDKIFRAGYDLGLDSAGIPNDHELYNRVVLCALGAFVAEVVNLGQENVANGENENVENNLQ